MKHRTTTPRRTGLVSFGLTVGLAAMLGLSGCVCALHGLVRGGDSAARPCAGHADHDGDHSPPAEPKAP